MPALIPMSAPLLKDRDLPFQGEETACRLAKGWRLEIYMPTGRDRKRDKETSGGLSLSQGEGSARNHKSNRGLAIMSIRKLTSDRR